MVTLDSGMLHTKELGQLSERERAVLNLAVKGFKDRAISEKLGISKGTVGTYWTRIRRKVGPVTRAEIAAMVGRVEGRESNSEMAAVTAKLSETCERLEAESARRRAAERYLHLLRRLATGVARYSIAGHRTELIIGTADQFADLEGDVLGFCNTARSVDAGAATATFLGYRLIPLGLGEILVARFA